MEENDHEILATARKRAYSELKSTPLDPRTIVGKKVLLEDGTCVGHVVGFNAGIFTVQTATPTIESEPK